MDSSKAMLALGMILTMLAMHMGVSLANSDSCNNISGDEEIGKSMSDDTLRVMSTSNNESLAQRAINALRHLISEPSDDNVIDDDQIEADETIHAKPDIPFDITLDSNPTTGYKWTVDFDHRFLSGGEENESATNTSRPALIGSGSKQRFTFTPIQEGRTTISAVYKRPWEDNAAENKTFLIIISE